MISYDSIFHIFSLEKEVRREKGDLKGPLVYRVYLEKMGNQDFPDLPEAEVSQARRVLQEHR